MMARVRGNRILSVHRPRIAGRASQAAISDTISISQLSARRRRIDHMRPLAQQGLGLPFGRDLGAGADQDRPLSDAVLVAGIVRHGLVEGDAIGVHRAVSVSMRAIVGKQHVRRLDLAQGLRRNGPPRPRCEIRCR